jgi:hypothetical protein
MLETNATFGKQPCFELWIDDPLVLIAAPGYWSRLRGLGVMSAAFMVDTTAPGFDLVYSARNIALPLELCRQTDIAAVATVWPEPSKVRIDEMCAELDTILGLGFVALENDVEHNWRTDKVVGFASLDDAAVYLVAKERELCEKHDLRLEMTTHTGHREAGPRAFLVRLVDRAYFQLYSTESDWRGRPVTFDGPRGPGRLQREFVERILRDVPDLADGKVELAVGLALYDQRWNGHTVPEALDAALAPLCAPDIVAIRGWSSKWLVGLRSNAAPQAAVRAWVQDHWGETR